MSNIKLKELIGGGTPLVYATTWEEDRIYDQILHIAQAELARPRQVVTWSCTMGLEVTRWDEERKEWVVEKSFGDDSKTPTTAIQLVQKIKGLSIFVFFDLYLYIANPETPAQVNPIVVRNLKDAIPFFKRHGTAILIGCRANIPPELEKEIMLVEFQLPTREELARPLVTVADKLVIEADVQHALIEAACGLTMAEAENAFGIALTRCNKFSKKAVDIVLDVKNQAIKKHGKMEFFRTSENMDNVGGVKNLKNWLVDRGCAFEQKARDFGLPYPKGVLLVGIQGAGKSLCAKAVSNTWQLPLIRLDIGALYSSLVGESERNTRVALQTAEAVAPVVLWIDEIEKGLSGMRSSGDLDSGVTARLGGTILTWMAEKTSPVFVVATANDITKLPPEFLRKGRFDEIFFVDLPSIEEREEIFRIHIEKVKRVPKAFDIAQLAQLCDGFTGAEIEQAVISALYPAYKQNRDINTDDIAFQIKETVPLSKTAKIQVDALREWAKTGHARMASEKKETRKERASRTIE